MLLAAGLSRGREYRRGNRRCGREPDLRCERVLVGRKLSRLLHCRVRSCDRRGRVAHGPGRPDEQLLLRRVGAAGGFKGSIGHGEGLVPKDALIDLLRTCRNELHIKRVELERRVAELGDVFTQ